MRVTDHASGTSQVLPMTRVATDPAGGEHGYDYWAATLVTPATPDILSYSFVAHDGAARRYLSDDPTLDGGAGQIGREPATAQDWQLTVQDPSFTTPAWARGATVYQVFPDRFANGDPSNDPSPMADSRPDRGRTVPAGGRLRQPHRGQELGPAPGGLLPGISGRQL